jgi:hypothetical protein
MPSKITSLAQLQKTREIVALAPSGNVYKLRPMNIERHALAGELPASLRKVAMQGAQAVDEAMMADQVDENGPEMRDYLDRLVRQSVVEPDLTDVDIDVLPPVDYRWIVRIALGEEDRDGEERRLWGKEPLSTWATFRGEHGCTEDCESCDRMRRSVADLQRGSTD